MRHHKSHKHHNTKAFWLELELLPILLFAFNANVNLVLIWFKMQLSIFISPSERFVVYGFYYSTLHSQQASELMTLSRDFYHPRREYRQQRDASNQKQIKSKCTDHTPTDSCQTEFNSVIFSFIYFFSCVCKCILIGALLKQGTHVFG